MEEASTQAKNKVQHYKKQAEDKANDYKNQAKDKVERKLQEGQQYATNKMNEGKVTFISFHVHSVWSIDDFYFLRFLLMFIPKMTRNRLKIQLVIIKIKLQ